MRSRARVFSAIYSTVLCGAMIAAFSALAMTGCGGGDDDDGSPSPSPTGSASVSPSPSASPAVQTAVKATIIWQAPGRIQGPPYAKSARLTLTGAGPGGADYSFVVDRGSTVSGPATYTSPATVLSGAYSLRVDFFSEANAGGFPVAFAEAGATVRTDGVLDTTIATYSIVRAIEIAAGQIATVGQKANIQFTARDDQNNVVAVVPDSVRVFVTDATTSLLQADATGTGVTGLAPGIAQVLIQVDDVSSAPQDVEVVSNAVVNITAPANRTIGIGEALDFDATVANAPSQAVTWSLVSGGGSIDANTGVYTAPATAGTATVRATSVYDPKKSASADVTIITGTANFIVQ